MAGIALSPTRTRAHLSLWCDGAHGAAENMQRDRELLEAADRDPAFYPMLRLFQFARPSVTLGYAQDPARVLDLARCERDGVEWAVRPTGGRAILHVHEWTWSLTTRIDDPDWGGSLAVAYQRVSAVIAASLRRLGIPAEAKAARHARDAGSGVAASGACFASTARHEITLGGRKLVGSAQRRTAHALLQQGSILLGPGHLALSEYVAVSDAERARIAAHLAAAATDASAYVGRDAPLERWAMALFHELHDTEGETATLPRLAALESAPYTARRP